MISNRANRAPKKQPWLIDCDGVFCLTSLLVKEYLDVSQVWRATRAKMN